MYLCNFNLKLRLKAACCMLYDTVHLLDSSPTGFHVVYAAHIVIKCTTRIA